MTRALLLTLLLLPSAVSAIVIRHDVDDALYRVPAAELPALVDLPGEGHGVLIAPQWVLTAAHAVTWQAEIKEVMLNGKPRAVARLVLHPGYQAPPPELIQQALATGDATLVLVLLASSDDVALLELASPVTDVVPASLSPDPVRVGQLVKLVGKGATGTGSTGHDPQGPNRTELRRAFNTISSADGRWFCFVFDPPPTGLPLEGTTGNGDSGSAVLVQVQEAWLLAGLPSWKAAHGPVARFRPGLYGQVSCNVRLSQYRTWIESVFTGAVAPGVGERQGGEVGITGSHDGHP